MTEYTTALYMRLSQEDDNIGESNSIKNQRDLLTAFATNHPELSKSKLLYFIDDGYSGVDFERPAVKDMLKQIREGKINCIAVKDFSRFGRNYIEVGSYLEQVFPFLGVRFLSVNDFYDSADAKGGSIGIEVGFKTLIYDLYSRDISVKAKSGRLTKMKKGEHTESTTPFGYVKSKVRKTAWEIDETAAVTIRRIFELALEGLKIREIAIKMNSEGFITPYTYRKNNGNLKGISCNTVDETTLWRPQNVSNILRNEKYTGKIVTGKKCHSKFGNHSGKKSISLPKSEWIVVPDAHEPIISQETFDAVQNIIASKRQRVTCNENVNVLAGKIFCGHCRHALRRYHGLTPKYVCNSSMELGDNCLPDTIYESAITERVLAALRTEIELADYGKRQAGNNNNLSFGKSENLYERIKKLSSDVARLKNSRETLFEKYSSGVTSKEVFLSKKSDISAKIEDAEAEIVRLTNEIEKRGQSAMQSEKQDKLIALVETNGLTPKIVSLIKRITVFDAAHIEIKFDFTDERCER